MKNHLLHLPADILANVLEFMKAEEAARMLSVSNAPKLRYAVAERMLAPNVPEALFLNLPIMFTYISFNQLQLPHLTVSQKIKMINDFASQFQSTHSQDAIPAETKLASAIENLYVHDPERSCTSCRIIVVYHNHLSKQQIQALFPTLLHMWFDSTERVCIAARTTLLTLHPYFTVEQIDQLAAMLIQKLSIANDYAYEAACKTLLVLHAVFSEFHLTQFKEQFSKRTSTIKTDCLKIKTLQVLFPHEPIPLLDVALYWFDSMDLSIQKSFCDAIIAFPSCFSKNTIQHFLSLIVSRLMLSLLN